LSAPAPVLPPNRPPIPFATFWHGPLHPIAYSCLASFPAAGLDLRVYSYAPDILLPPGIELADARSIIADETLASRYISDGKPTLAKFANLFRYRMIADTGRCWVDCDVLCLRPERFPRGPSIFGLQGDKEHHHAIGNAVLWTEDQSLLAAMTAEAEAAADLNQPWGATGPALLTKATRARGLDVLAAPKSVFYPIPWAEFYKPLLPLHRDEVERATAGSSCLHLWNELFNRSGYDRSVAPPAGSFLHDACARLGTASRFTRVYELDELTELLKPWMRAANR
jgi:hypothetical protein